MTGIDLEQPSTSKCFANIPFMRENVYGEEAASIEAVVYEAGQHVAREDSTSTFTRDGKQKILEKMFMDGFLKRHPRRRIIHDIMYDRASRERSLYLAGLCQQSNYNGSLLLIASHGDHYHVMHDCAYTGSTCRCTLVQFIRRGRRCSRKVVWSWRVSNKWWTNIANYFNKPERQIIYFEISGRIWHDCRQIRSLSTEHGIKFGEEPMVEIGADAIDFHNFIQCGPEEHVADQNAELHNTKHERTDGSREDRKAAAIYKWILGVSTSPLNKVFTSGEWVNSKYKFKNVDSIQIKNILDLVKRKYANSSIQDLIKMYRTKCKQVYFAAPNNFTDYYYDTDKSLAIMEKIALFQNNNNLANTKQFLIDVHAICEKKIPKRNALIICSPSNAGKNLFFDSIVHWYSNYGQIANFNRQQQFPLMDAVNRRICMWNEPMCETSAFEDVKMLFGGDSMKVRVKYSNDAVVDRTPIIVLTNNDIFPSDVTFQCRIIKYMWQSMPELKYVKKHINPWAYIELLKKYKVINEVGDDWTSKQQASLNEEDSDTPSDVMIESSNESEQEDYIESD